jgi:hypothetical protein
MVLQKKRALGMLTAAQGRTYYVWGKMAAFGLTNQGKFKLIFIK